MNNNMEIALNIKNDYTFKMVETLFENMELDRNEAVEKAVNLGIHALAQSITGAFISDLFGEATQNNIPLDLSYDTVKELTACAARVYTHNINVNGMEPAEAKRLFCRMIAAYLIYLCANEHGCKLDVRKLSSAPSLAEDEKYWSSCLEIRIGNKTKVNFLVAAIEGMKFSALKKTITGQEWFSVEPLVEAYQKATGVNLAEKGFCDVALKV